MPIIELADMRVIKAVVRDLDLVRIGQRNFAI
jgi:hypothetical protein